MCFEKNVFWAELSLNRSQGRYQRGSGLQILVYVSFTTVKMYFEWRGRRATKVSFGGVRIDWLARRALRAWRKKIRRGRVAGSGSRPRSAEKWRRSRLPTGNLPPAAGSRSRPTAAGKGTAG